MLISATLKNDSAGKKRSYPMKRSRSSLAILISVLYGAGALQAQIVEHFTSETDGSQCFSERGLSLGLIGSHLYDEVYSSKV
jgi:hypothetical protein